MRRVPARGRRRQPEDMVALARSAAPGHRRLVPHLPGYGRTPMVDGPHRLEDVQRWVEAAVTARGAGEAALVGYSLGAYQALAIAVAGRLPVTRLVLIGGFAAVAPGHRDALLGLTPVLAAAPDFADPGLRGLMHGMLAPAFAATHPEALARVESWLESDHAGGARGRAGSSARAPDLRDRLAGVAHPVDADRRRARRLGAAGLHPRNRRRNPQAVAHVLPGHGHALPIEAFDRLAQLVASGLA